jgi:hypothetical protein
METIDDDWCTSFPPDQDREWNTYVEDTSSIIHLPLPAASKKEREIHEQQVYLRRLESASKRLAKKKKRQKRTFAQALKNLSTGAVKLGSHFAVLDDSDQCGVSPDTAEDDDRPLLGAYQQKQSQMSPLDLERARQSTSPSWCERCARHPCKDACVVS